MHILLTGATGFIGRHLCARLLQDGHTVTAAVRDTASIERRFPGIHARPVDMNRMAASADWLPLLRDAEAVVNCAGILQSGAGQSASAIHADAPRALFDACVTAGLRRVVQISAVSADIAAGTEYARSKKAADDYLRSLDLDWVVLRPSLVYAQGSYGGTSAIRGLAGLPFFIPLIGSGDQKFQPLHIDDLSETVARCLESRALAHQTLDPVGAETLSLREIIAQLRSWLDLPPARFIRVPPALVRVMAWFGDFLGSGPLRTTALTQMEYGNVSDSDAFARAIGFRPRSLGDALRQSPSHVQDRWHARLYSLRPALTACLVLLWLGSGIIGLFEPPEDWPAMAARWDVSLGLTRALQWFFCLLDLALGLAVASGRARRLLGIFQLALVASYTLGLTFLMPALWLDPFGPLLKNLPILAAIGVWSALQDDK
jgi:uncharacterized protein YbjT (DUF2867 family)